MVSLDDVEEFRSGVTGAADEARDWVASELSGYMAEHPAATVEGLRERAIDALLTADSSFSERACELSAQMFERTCPGMRPAVLADAMPREDAEAIARYQAGKLREDDREGFVSQVAQAARDRAMRRSSETTAKNAARNASRGVRYARIPTGGETCPWCLMLASRGFAYRSASAATHSHRHCDCIALAAAGVDRDGRGEDGALAVEGYDRSPYLDAYASALESGELTPDQIRRASVKAGASSSSRSYKALIAEVDGAGDLRALEDAYVVASEQMALRGASAATRGKLAEAVRAKRTELGGGPAEGSVSFVSEQVEKRATDAEKRTAARLASHGMSPKFIQDYEWVTDESGRKRKVGLPDLEGGIEIKTLGTSGNAYGAVDNYLDSASGKKGLTCVVIDNSESERIGDEELLSAARKIIGDYQGIPGLKVLLKSGELVTIK